VCCFLDEFPEFSPQVLDSLRQQFESDECVVARVNHHVSYPVRIIQLVAAMNPCRCGMAGEPGAIATPAFSPAMEAIREISSSSRASGGDRSDCMRWASIDLPAPGELTKIRLCLAAAATSSAFSRFLPLDIGKIRQIVLHGTCRRSRTTHHLCVPVEMIGKGKQV